MITRDMVWVKAYLRGPYSRGTTPVGSHTRARAQRRRSPATRSYGAPELEHVAPYVRGPHELPEHQVPGYWRSRPSR